MGATKKQNKKKCDRLYRPINQPKKNEISRCEPIDGKESKA
jgi:hypothetical protein